MRGNSVFGYLLAGLVFLVSICGTEYVYCAEGESLTLDPESGNYTLVYYGEGGVLQTVVWIPATKIVPYVKSRFHEVRDSGLFEYRFEIVNDKRGRQNIADSGIQVRTLEGEEVTPKGWDSANTLDVKTNDRYNVGWWEGSPDPLAGIKPGARLHGFGVDSTDLAGIGEMQVSGGTPRQGFPDEGPDPYSPVAKEFDAVYDNDYVVRYVAIPWIRVPTPFAAAPILSDLQRHVDEELVAMGHIDASLATRLDPLFQSAIAAAQGGNVEALRGNLRELRRALKSEQGHEQRHDHEEDACEVEDKGERHRLDRDRPISKLARDVLEFDLRYIEKRLGPGRKH